MAASDRLMQNGALEHNPDFAPASAVDLEEQLATRAAWLYFLGNSTQAQIAKKLGLTRQRVNRLLSHAREQGLVQINITGKLAACVALRPLTSLYWWQGRLECCQEVQLLIKSRASLLADLDAAVHRLHSYSTPEWLHWQAGSSEAYGLWLRESCLKPLNPDGSGPAGGDQPGGGGPAG